MTRPRALAAAAALTITAAALTGCVAKADAAASPSISVTSTDTACDLSTATAPSGTVTFDVSNTGSQITEFYLFAEDGVRIVGEVESIAPGAKRSLTVVAQPGSYKTLCKPGMVGSGVGMAAFEVTGSRVKTDGADADAKKKAVDLYAAFVKDQVGQMLPAVTTFAAAYAAGDDATAKARFPVVRGYYERIEPVASSLSDLDPKIDYRELDAQADGIPWTGFHRFEKDLWQPAQDAVNSDQSTPAWQDWSPSTPAERTTYADGLVANVQTLYDYVHAGDFRKNLESQGIAALSNGASALLDEVATGKIEGEEDWWSGTDLYDFTANVEGSKMAFSLVRDLARSKGAAAGALVAEIDKGYAGIEAKLATYGSFDTGFVPYSHVTEGQRRELSDLINALAEPLSQLTSTVLK
ncbi:iron uptake system protein EfeO [Microbacterium rhizosphaerae]|uniref:Iron uptake system protein EfeO n=1 Tax=Microbacterium rhizosphaerae TaxID=1678237 RepID=A0ABZ0SJG8_9MICO|nr:iron uptake system protein EfeO [Microbacterium rhizosphaerae]WPR88768.1 iron uptake system protein EfeO [Microbacterium rhizosphaerae]